MKKGIRVYPLIVMGLLLALCNGCSKDGNEGTAEIKDVDGNIYTSVTIGTQTWLVENLKVTKYRNGDLIGTSTPVGLDLSNVTEPKYQWACNGAESNVAVYGRLYTWHAVNDSRKIAPAGWHVATDAEWTTLTTFLGGDAAAGGKLKEEGTLHWQSPNTDALNTYGFTALPQGYRSYDGPFYGIGYASQFWTSTENLPLNAWLRILNHNNGTLGRSYSNKADAFCVRCVKD